MPEDVNTPSCCVHSCFPEWQAAVPRVYCLKMVSLSIMSSFISIAQHLHQLQWGGGGSSMQIKRFCKKYIILPFCREKSKMIIRHLWTKETVHLMLWLKQCYKRPAEGPVELRVTACVMQQDCYSRAAKNQNTIKLESYGNVHLSQPTGDLSRQTNTARRQTNHNTTPSTFLSLAKFQSDFNPVPAWSETV